VDDLLADVKNEKWEKVSVEFCGGTHVQRTGEIKSLVIIEESGIAKGIRRIVAVTGQDAYDVQRVAANFEDELARLEKMKFSPQKEAEAKRLQVQLNQLSISAITRARLRDTFAKISKSILDEQKVAAKTENKRVVDAITNHFKENVDSKVLVQKVDWSGNVNKAISEAIKVVSGPKAAAELKGKSVYLVAASPEEGKVVHGCYVAEVCFDPFSPLAGGSFTDDGYSLSLPRALRGLNGHPTSLRSSAARRGESPVLRVLLGRVRMPIRWMRVSRRRGSILRTLSFRLWVVRSL